MGEPYLTGLVLGFLLGLVAPILIREIRELLDK